MPGDTDRVGDAGSVPTGARTEGSSGIGDFGDIDLADCFSGEVLVVGLFWVGVSGGEFELLLGALESHDGGERPK